MPPASSKDSTAPRGALVEQDDDDEVPSNSNDANTAEIVARLAVSLSVSVARAVLHTPADKLLTRAAASPLLPRQIKEKASEAAGHANFDFASLAEKILRASSQALKDRGLSRPELEMTAEAFGVVLRLATEFTGPLEGVDAAHVYDATMAYYQMQKVVREAEAEAAHAAASSAKHGSRSDAARETGAKARSEIAGRRATCPDAQELDRYCRFAMACYGNRGMKFLGILWEDDESKWSDIHAHALEYMTGIDPVRDLVASSWRANWTGSIYRPGHYLLVDHASKEVILAIRGSYRAQDVVTDLMCEDTEFNFHYDRREDLRNAKRELEEVFASLNKAVSGLESGAPDLTLGELESSMRDTTGSIFAQLQGWVAKQSQLVEEQLRRAESSATTATAASEPGDVVDQSESESENEGTAKGKLGASGAKRHSAARALGAAILPTQLRKAMSKAQQIEAESKYAGSGPENVPRSHRRIKGRVHFGFLKSAQALASELEDTVVETMQANKGYKLVLVGHSLGAAVATLLTLMWARHKVLKSARCYVYAPPCSVTRNVAESALAMSRIKGVVLADDLVPRLSLGSASDFRSAVVFCAKELMPGDTKGRTVAQYINDATKAGVPVEKLAPRLQPVLDLLRSEHMRHHKLFPAGTLWHIEEDDGTIATAVRKPCTAFSELVLSRGMFHPHLPQRYAHACCDRLHLSAVDAAKERTAEATRERVAAAKERTAEATRERVAAAKERTAEATGEHATATSRVTQGLKRLSRSLRRSNGHST